MTRAGGASPRKAIPCGLLQGGKVTAPIKKGELITYANARPTTRCKIVELRRAQDVTPVATSSPCSAHDHGRRASKAVADRRANRCRCRILPRSISADSRARSEAALRQMYLIRRFEEGRRMPTRAA